MRRAAILLVAVVATPAPGQGMAGMNMPGMTMPGMTMPAAKKQPPARPPAAKPPAGRPASRKPTASPAHDMATMPDMVVPAAAGPVCPPEHAAMGHCAPTGMSEPAIPAGTTLPTGDAAPPPPPPDRAADRFYPSAAMVRASRRMRREHGGMASAQILFNLAEYQLRRGRDGYRWDGEGGFGGDVHRLVVKTEGSGGVRGGIDDAEVQALYSRAVDPYFNLRGGLRQDLGRGAKRTYATVGIEGLAPYWWEVEAALFLSPRGDLLGRLEAYHDQRVTQRLILQPRVELNIAAQNVAASRIGSGLSNAELGLRLRYEVTRRFAPYAGLSWNRKIGNTARFARDRGETVGAPSAAFGVRARF